LLEVLGFPPKSEMRKVEFDTPARPPAKPALRIAGRDWHSLRPPRLIRRGWIDNGSAPTEPARPSEVREAQMPEIRRHHTSARMSQIVEHGELVYLAGQVASDTTTDVAGQTQQILDTIDTLLGEVGLNKTKLLSATIWLANMGDYAAMNEVWDAWVPDGHAPARTCVETRLAAPRYVVEITVVAGR
jgi:enamine deaminase RidA (YjgF/YER057c/UK114 family)